MSESDLAVAVHNEGLQMLKDSGFIKDFDPSKTKYDSEKKIIYYSYTSTAPIKRVQYSDVGFNFDSINLPDKEI